MKKIILLLAVVGFFVQAQAQSQELMVKDVPTAVTTAFYKMYPSIKEVNWSKDGLFIQQDMLQTVYLNLRLMMLQES